jgi:7-cyano-7-deazaguanine synthase
VELAHLRRFLAELRLASLQPLHLLELPVADLYGAHWSLHGRNVPDADSADAAVYLPGRNVLLLAKSLIWCHLHEVPAVALAVLRGNPFADATPAFFAGFAAAVNQGIGGAVEVLRPYAGLSKTEVLRRGQHLPLERTFSCIQPAAGQHCGRCNKCGERRRAFAHAGLPDHTVYHSEGSCIA